MSAFWTTNRGLVSVLALLLGSLAGVSAGGPLVGVDDTRLEVHGRDSDVNNIQLVVSNVGSLAYDWSSGSGGLLYPRGTYNAAVYAAGLWVGAKVEGDTRVTMSEYSFEFQPGTVLENGQWGDPDDPSYRVYEIQPGDTPDSNPDYAEWPIQDGAPVDGNGDPRHFGGQTLWAVFNDLDPSQHQNDGGSTAPLGIEVRQLAFASDYLGAGSNTVFVQWNIGNRATVSLEDVYLSLWVDPDLGGSGDDLVGCDPASSLGYCYNATNDDEQYGPTPPAVGVVLVQGPIVPSPGDQAYVSGEWVPGFRNLSMSSYTAYENGTDPRHATESYNYLQGLERDGSSVIDPTTGAPTSFAFSGDPVTGEGWVDTHPTDRRFMVNVGPFEMEPGETQTVAVAFVVGQGQDRLGSLSTLREHARQAVPLFRTAMEGTPGACCTMDGCLVTPPTSCDGTFTPGGSCDPDPCPIHSGACCFDNGTCLLTTPDDCPGSYHGDGSECLPGACPELGGDSACCLGSGVCEVLTERVCGEHGGTYLAAETCDLLPPGNPPGWQTVGSGAATRPMIDEIRGANGVPVPPDGNGGPGNAVWLSLNSTNEWRMSADRYTSGFTADGEDEKNLQSADLVLRWDQSPDNYGWWAFEDQSAARIPFGLYEVGADGTEERLIVVLDGLWWTPGIYDISPVTSEDGYLFWPATDRAYAYRGDYDAFLVEAADGYVDEAFPLGEELFAAMIFSSETSRLPALGTVIQFSTRDNGIDVGTGFESEVPLSWPSPAGQARCIASPVYEVLRDGVWIGSTERNDYIDDSVVDGESYSYSVRTRNPFTGEVSPPSIAFSAQPQSGGYMVDVGWRVADVTVDGEIGVAEWANSAVRRANDSVSGTAAEVRWLSDLETVWIGVEDDALPATVDIFLDVDGNGTYDNLDGVLTVHGGTRTFTPLLGEYPDVVPSTPVDASSWTVAAGTSGSLEVALSLDGSPLAGAIAQGSFGAWVHVPSGAAEYPPGPESVLELAPKLFSEVRLLSAPPPAISLAPHRLPMERSSARAEFNDEWKFVTELLAAPNPVVRGSTLVYRVPEAQFVSVHVYDAAGALVQVPIAQHWSDAGVFVAQWEPSDRRGSPLSSGVYFLEVRGQTFRWTSRVSVIR